MKILIVDDEENITNGIASIIEMNTEFSVALKIAYDGQQAYKIAKAFQPDLVITDTYAHDEWVGFGKNSEAGKVV